MFMWPFGPLEVRACKLDPVRSSVPFENLMGAGGLARALCPESRGKAQPGNQRRGQSQRLGGFCMAS